MKFFSYVIIWLNFQIFFAYNIEKNLNTTKVNWIFFDALAYRDPTFDKTSLRDIDCQIASNIVYLEEKNINFERDYVLDFNNLDLANNFQKNLNELRLKCPNVKIAFDPQFRFTNEFNKILLERNIPVHTITQSIANFVKKYQANGFVVHFGNFAPDYKSSELFFLSLSCEFKKYNLEILGHFSPSQDFYQYIEPRLFRYLDYMQLQLTDWGNMKPNKLNSQSATYPNCAKFIPGTFYAEHNMDSVIKRFINLGAPRSKLSVEISIFGYAYKRSLITYDTSIGSAAEGLGSYAYNDTFLPIGGKDPYPYIYDYKTVCRIVKDQNWIKNFDDIQKASYSFNQNTWVSYNSFESIRFKIELVKNMNIGGVWVDAINYDDLTGVCNGIPYPAITYINSLM